MSHGLSPAILGRSLADLERAKPVHWWRLLHDLGVALFTHGFVDEAFRVWAQRDDPAVPVPPLGRSHYLDHLLPEVGAFVAGRAGKRGDPEPLARRVDRSVRIHLAPPYWTQLPTPGRAGLPGEALDERERLDWYGLAITLMRPSDSGDGPDPARGAEILRSLLDHLREDHLRNNARLLLADHLARRLGKEAEAADVLRSFFANQYADLYVPLALIPLARVLAAGAFREECSLGSVEVGAFTDRLAHLMERRRAAAGDPSPPGPQYRVTTLDNVFMLEPKTVDADAGAYFSQPGEVDRGYSVIGSGVAISAPGEMGSCQVKLEVGPLREVDAERTYRFLLDVAGDLYLRAIGLEDEVGNRFAVPPGRYHVEVAFLSVTSSEGGLDDWDVLVQLAPS